MFITDIADAEKVICSARSITVKKDGKTVGVVRATNFMSLQPNKQVEFWKEVRQAEKLHKKISRSDFYVVDNKLYYILKNPMHIYESEKSAYDEYVSAVYSMDKSIPIVEVGKTKVI